MSQKYKASPQAIEQGLQVAYAALGLMAVVPIYFGSYASLKTWKNPRDKTTKHRASIQEGEETQDQDAPTESLSQQDAFMFPILGSAALFGLHFLFQNVEAAYINYALAAYVSFLGVMVVTQVGVSILDTVAAFAGIKVEKWHVNLVKKSKEFYTARFTIFHLVVMLASVLLSGYYAVTKNWIATNIFAVSFALNAIQLLSLDSFQAGMTLLVGLCLYDFGWSYGAEIMTSVSGSLDGPFKVLFPRLLLGLPAGQAFQFLQLSLGDIVVPGMFVALCLRFDQHRAGSRNPSLGRSTRFAKPYFGASLAGYIAGLACAIFDMHTSKVAQPALVFLAPACALSVLFLGAVRGEIKHIFAYKSEEGLENMKRKEADQKRRANRLASARQAPRVKLPSALRDLKEESHVGTPVRNETPSSTPAASAPEPLAAAESEVGKSPRIQGRKSPHPQKN